MAKLHTEITQDLSDWISIQPMFFVASAPLAKNGHVNVSPRGLDSLRILSPKQVLLLDYTGSGNETAAHCQENGRLTVMFCAFTGLPKILRLYGSGKSLLPDHPQWDSLRTHFPADVAGVRQLFLLDVTRIQTSCGFGVPLMDFVQQRENLPRFSAKKTPQELEKYRHQHNSMSIDEIEVKV